MFEFATENCEERRPCPNPFPQAADHAARLTRAQEEVIDYIERAANDPATYLDMNFEPGDMQFLKNASILHKRTEYEDWPEPARKRHLLRLWLVEPSFSGGDEFLRKGVAQRFEGMPRNPGIPRLAAAKLRNDGT